MKPYTVMRYILVAADKSSKLPINIPDDIIVKIPTSIIHKTPKLKAPKKKVKRNSSKSKTLVKKHKQSAKSIAK